MNCKKCGFQLNERDQFCKNCGTPVDNASVQNNNEGLGNQTMQDYSQPTIQQQNMSQQSMNNYNDPNMQQPNLTSGYNSQPTNQTSKNSNTKFIIIGIVVVALVVGVIVAINLLNNNKSGSNNNSSVANNNSSYTVKFNGFTFKIPTNLVYETQTNFISLGDEEGTWAAHIEVIEGTYSKMLSNKSQLQSLFQKEGFTASAAEEKTIGRMPFITLELSKGGINALIGYAKATSTNLFGVTLYNMDNEYDYKTLKEVSNVLSSAEYTGESNNMSSFEKIDMSVITELAK